MGNALFADISSFNSVGDWSAYKRASAQGDGISRVLLRDDQGVGVPDSKFEQFWAGAIGVGIDEIFVYHYAYPNLHPGSVGAIAEARSMAAVVGTRLHGGDKVMLDLEQNESSAWALAFGQELLRWHPTTSKPVIYDSLSHIEQFLTDPALPAIFDLALADWTFNPNSRPAAPAPWKAYAWLQYTDRGVFPGLAGTVDMNVFLGGPPVDYRAQQASVVWAQTPYPNTTAIHQVWLDAYEKGIVSGPPIGAEFSTVDWFGAAIRCQYFGSGVRIEYYPSGVNHGYSATGRLW